MRRSKLALTAYCATSGRPSLLRARLLLSILSTIMSVYCVGIAGKLFQRMKFVDTTVFESSVNRCLVPQAEKLAFLIVRFQLSALWIQLLSNLHQLQLLCARAPDGVPFTFHVVSYALLDRYFGRSWILQMHHREEKN